MTEGLVETNGIASDFTAAKTETSNGYEDHEVGAGSTNGDYEETKLAFDESYMPVPGLQFTVEQDGYRYYADPQTQRQYSLDSAGYWYVMNDDGYFEAVEIPAEPNPTPADELMPVASQVDNKDRARSRDITYDDDGFPVFPTNEKGLPVLPRNEKDQPIFPLDPNGKPVFPYDRKTGLWSFPVDDCEDPIFPRTEEGNPIVPQDQKGSPIFPKDSSGEFIFPVDESNFPIPAVTLDGKRVLPTDEFGNPVIPRDREGKPLIHFSADGVTPLSNAEYKVWKQFQKQYKNYPAQHHAVKSREAFDSPLHPLNLAHQASLFMAEMEILQRGRRVRPEDIDLPDMGNSPQPGDENSQHSANGSADQAAAEDEKAQKRRKFLAAQLKSTKKVAEPKKDEPMGPKEPPAKPTSNPLAVEKRKSRSSSKPKRDASSSPDSKHRHKKADKKKEDKKRSHHKEKGRRHKRRHSSGSSDSDTDASPGRHRRTRHRKRSPSSDQSSSSSSSDTHGSSSDSESPSPKRRRERSKRRTSSRSDKRRHSDSKTHSSSTPSKDEEKKSIKAFAAADVNASSPHFKEVRDAGSDMDVSDESRPPSPPRPSNEELKRLEEEEEERAAKKKQVIEDLNGELLAVKERILDTEKSHEEVQAKINQLESEREEHEKALSCLREHEKRLLARKDAAERDDSP